MTQPDRPVSRKAPAKSAAMEADDLRRQAENRLRDHAEQTAARYTDLYDFAPVGYLTLNRKGIYSSQFGCRASGFRT
jgi:hypothetical protein